MLNNLEHIEAWAEQIYYWRTHLDIAIEEMFGVRLTEEQAVVAREVGNCSESGMFSSRGFGKTFVAALIASALCVLYPESKGITLSGTIAQATLIIQKIAEIAETHPYLKQELIPVSRKSLITYSKATGGRVMFKNGSTIESMAIDSARGRRASFIFVDELLELNKPLIDSVASPILNYKREICTRIGFAAEPTKLILLSSGFPQGHTCYEYVTNLKSQMEKGNRNSFVCSIPFDAAVRSGLTDASFFEQEKRRLSEDDFNMEYKSWFINGNSNGVFPYADVEKIRVLKDIELLQKKNTSAHYIICADLATSQSSVSDNTVLSVLKYTELSDGTYLIQLVYLRSYNGKQLDYIANEIRKLYHLKFPSAEKIIYDAKGLGITFPRFFDHTWSNGAVEYQPLLVDSEFGSSAILHPVNATNQYNVAMVNNFKMLIEQGRLELPVSARIIRETEAEQKLKSFEEEDQREEQEPKHKLTMEERAVYIESDALASEFGNIIEIRSQAGNVLYDTQNIRKKKDRWSSVGMGINYILDKEEKNIKYGRQMNHSSLGVVSDLYDEGGWGSDLDAIGIF